MFCSNCGRNIPDGSRFCSECGTELRIPAVYFPTEKKSFFQKLRSWLVSHKTIAAVIAAVIVGMAVIFTGIAGGSYKSVVKKYMKAIQDQDGALYMSIMAEDYKKSLMYDWSFSDSELQALFQETVDDFHDEIAYDCGEDFKLDYQIVSVYRPTDKELKSLNSWMKDYGFEKEITDAVVTTIRVTAVGSEGKDRYTEERLILKSHGKWCITGGYIDFSWYEQ